MHSPIARALLVILFSFSLLAGCAGLAPENQHALETLQGEAASARLKVKDKLRDNPHSAVEQSLAALDSILEYAEAVKADPARFSPERLREYQQKIAIINENLDRFSDLTLQADVSFPLGKYRLEDLSEYARGENQKLLDKILLTLEDIQVRYPNQGIQILFKIVGYTDETAFTPGTTLEQAITRKLGEPVAEDEIRRRRQYNQVLSLFRAETLGQYFAQHLKGKLDPEQVRLIIKTLGKGEVLPEKYPASDYLATDPRRRICIISPFIEVIP